MAAPRYLLGTFGTLTLIGPGNVTVLGQHGHHRRRLALLAVLAAAGERGRTRDQLLVLFWPEAAQARARRSLDQLLYELRSTIASALFASADPVRLNPEVLESDVDAFNTALARGELEAAVTAYRGPFLDGVHIGGAPELDRWLETERARLERSYTGALEKLAQRADADGDHARAIEWWRRLTESDALSSKNATGLIRTLMNAGEHAAALRHAERFEALVSQELGTSAGPNVAALVAEARAGAGPDRVVARISSSEAAAASPPPEMEPGGASDEPSSVATLSPFRPAHVANAPRRHHRTVVVAGLALVAAVTAASVAMARVRQSTRSQIDAESSIAVLPFENVSRDREDSVLVDGLSEELTSALSKLQNVRVIARASTVAFRNRGLGARHIADSLGVAHLVEGSVQKSGSHFRVRVRLVNASDGATRWSDTYDRERGDILVVESEIAAAVARELGLRMLGGGTAPRPHRGTHDIAAYELYVRGRDPIHFRSATDSGPLEGLALLQQAVALDSGYAAAYAHMPAMYYALTTYADLDRARRLKRLADSTAQLAVRLDSSLPEAYMALGKADQIGLSDLPGAETAFRRSIALGGSPRVHELLADNLSWTGLPEEALEEATRSAKEDPLSASAAAEVGKHLCLNHRYAEGIAELARVAAVRPPLQRASLYTAICYVMQDRWPDAIAKLRGTSDPRGSKDPRVRSVLGYALARSGRTAEARQIQSELLAEWRSKRRGAYELAVVTAGLGDDDQAFAWLDRAVGDLSLYGYIMYPLFKELQADPRFEQFRARLGASSRERRAVPAR